MLRGLVLCGLGLVTAGLGIKHIYDVKKAEAETEAEVQEVQEEQEPVIEIAD